MPVNGIITEIIFCRNDTFSERTKLLVPSFVSILLTYLILFILSFFFDLNLKPLDFVIMIAVFTLTIFLSKRFKSNPVLFLPSFYFFTISIKSLYQFPEGYGWILYQLLSMLLINFIGSTRCNLVNFILLISTIGFANLFEIDSNQVIYKQIPLYASFPLLLLNSYYKTLFNISKLKSVQDVFSLERELIKQQQIAAAGELTSIVSHEVNNALTILRGGVIKLQKEYTIPSEDLKYINKSSDMIHEIVSIIKRKSFISTSKSKFDLSKVLSEEVSLISSQMELGISLELEVTSKNNLVFANQGELALVVANLISNAKDALYDQEVKEKKISIFLEQNESELRLRIKDNGTGISAENFDKIFEKNFTTKSKGKGSGLGLYYVQTIIKNNKGRIEVTSSPESGTEFTIYLPPAS
jgi:signal transduction histidine kinase